MSKIVTSGKYKGITEGKVKKGGTQTVKKTPPPKFQPQGKTAKK